MNFKFFKHISIPSVLAMAMAVTGLAGLSSCSDDDLPGGSNVEEGLPVSGLRITVGVPEPKDASMSRASDEAETRIDRLALIFYRKTLSNDKPVCVKEITNLGAPNQVSATNYIYTFTLNLNEANDGLSSGNYYLYAVANYGTAFADFTLEDLKNFSLNEIQNKLVNGTGDLDFVSTSVLMTGKYMGEGSDGSLTVYPDKADGTMDPRNNLGGDDKPALVMRRVIAKSIFNFTTGADPIKFFPKSYTVHNIPTSSTIFERNGWTDKNGNVEATGTTGNNRVSFPGSLPNTQTNWVNKSGDKFSSTVAQGTTASSFSFYTQENVQSPANLPDGITWNYNLREARQDANYNTFTYAPQYATYVEVTGDYQDPTYRGQVTYTIHLGDFSTATGDDNNFTVRRNFRYTYNVKINGVNKIIVEAQAGDEEYQNGAEGTIFSSVGDIVNLDSHYDQVLLQINKSGSNMGTVTFTITTPYGTKTVSSAGELGPNDDYKWVEFAKPASTTTFQSYTALKNQTVNNGQGDKLYYLPELIDNLTNHSSDTNNDHFIVSGDKVFVAAYVNEYYYEGESDLSHFVNAADRIISMDDNRSVSADGHSIYCVSPVFQIRQKSIKTGFNLTVANPFGVESVKETPASWLKSSTAASDVDYSSGTEDEIWGWDNTAREFRTGTSYSHSWSTYIDEANAGWKKDNNGNYAKPATYMKSGYDYALYQVLQRNRDLDGNGLIDADEIRWFVPSHLQCLALWYSNPGLPSEIQVAEGKVETMITSSNRDDRVWWNDEGTAFGPYNHSDNRKLFVRAIRALGQGMWNRRTSLVSSYNPTTRTVTMNNLAASCTRTSGFTGNYSAHFRSEAPDILPQAFQIAQNEIDLGSYTAAQVATLATIGSDYSELADKSDKGQWRVPNEKELGLMFQYFSPTLSYGTMARTQYDRSAAHDKSDIGYYFVQVGQTKLTTNNSADGDVKSSDKTNRKVRLVRDVQPENGNFNYDGQYQDGGSLNTRFHAPMRRR